ncbi:hypothetical protein OROHE_008480 [Orobanche hederae]
MQHPGLYAHVYSLKSDSQEWKKISSAPPCVPWGNHNMVYVAATGKSYWLAGDDAVLSFDFSSEEFDYFDLPSLPYFYCPLENLLVKLRDGLLGLVRHWVRGGDSYGHYYELWVRREEVGEWVRMFDTVCLGGGAGRPIGLVDARFLLLKGIPDCDNASSVMLVYDWTTKKCVDNDPRLYMHEGLIDVLSYVEETTDVLQRESIQFDASLPRTSIKPMQRIPRKIKDIEGLHENTRGGKHGYRLIVHGKYKDWADNGFRVLDDYHPSKDRHVFKLDRGPHISVEIRSRNGLYDDRYDDGPYVYEDELYELNDDEVKIGDGLEIGDGLKIDNWLKKNDGDDERCDSGGGQLRIIAKQKVSGAPVEQKDASVNENTIRLGNIYILILSTLEASFSPSQFLVYEAVGELRAYQADVATVTEEEIHKLLLSFAEAVANVARLKGGDPLVFGRGGEEMDILQQGIEVKVIPGIC